MTRLINFFNIERMRRKYQNNNVGLNKFRIYLSWVYEAINFLCPSSLRSFLQLASTDIMRNTISCVKCHTTISLDRCGEPINCTLMNKRALRKQVSVRTIRNLAQESREISDKFSMPARRDRANLNAYICHVRGTFKIAVLHGNLN